MQTGDAAHALDRSPAMVRIYVVQGKLPVAATTPRGVRLFRAEDVETLRQQLAEESVARVARKLKSKGLLVSAFPSPPFGRLFLPES